MEPVSSRTPTRIPRSRSWPLPGALLSTFSIRPRKGISAHDGFEARHSQIAHTHGSDGVGAARDSPGSGRVRPPNGAGREGRSPRPNLCPKIFLGSFLQDAAEFVPEHHPV